MTTEHAWHAHCQALWRIIDADGSECMPPHVCPGPTCCCTDTLDTPLPCSLPHLLYSSSPQAVEAGTDEVLMLKLLGQVADEWGQRLQKPLRRYMTWLDDQAAAAQQKIAILQAFVEQVGTLGSRI